MAVIIALFYILLLQAIQIIVMTDDLHVFSAASAF